jgi:hypothetical protein
MVEKQRLEKEGIVLEPLQDSDEEDEEDEEDMTKQNENGGPMQLPPMMDSDTPMDIN